MKKQKNEFEAVLTDFGNLDYKNPLGYARHIVKCSGLKPMTAYEEDKAVIRVDKEFIDLCNEFLKRTNYSKEAYETITYAIKSPLTELEAEKYRLRKEHEKNEH